MHVEPCMAAPSGSLPAVVGDDVGGGCSCRPRGAHVLLCRFCFTGELVGIINRFWHGHFFPPVCAGKFQCDSSVCSHLSVGPFIPFRFVGRNPFWKQSGCRSPGGSGSISRTVFESSTLGKAWNLTMLPVRMSRWLLDDCEALWAV